MEALRAAGAKLRFAAGEMVARSGEPVTELLHIAEGEVKSSISQPAGASFP